MKKDKKTFKDLAILIAFVLIVIVIAEGIGKQTIVLGKVTISILPLVFAVTIAMILGIPKIRKGILKKYTPIII